jgi:hypothetical protein
LDNSVVVTVGLTVTSRAVLIVSTMASGMQRSWGRWSLPTRFTDNLTGGFRILLVILDNQFDGLDIDTGGGVSHLNRCRQR